MIVLHGKHSLRLARFLYNRGNIVMRIRDHIKEKSESITQASSIKQTIGKENRRFEYFRTPSIRLKTQLLSFSRKKRTLSTELVRLRSEYELQLGFLAKEITFKPDTNSVIQNHLFDYFYDSMVSIFTSGITQYIHMPRLCQWNLSFHPRRVKEG